MNYKLTCGSGFVGHKLVYYIKRVPATNPRVQFRKPTSTPMGRKPAYGAQHKHTNTLTQN